MAEGENVLAAIKTAIEKNVHIFLSVEVVG